MNLYKNENGSIYGYNDWQEVPANMIKLTSKEVENHKPVEPEINPKYEGEVYTLNDIDYQVSFMKDDADGMMQVSMAFQLGLTETVIYFENGTKMPIKNTEFEAFAIWFVGKRNSFFVGE